MFKFKMVHWAINTSELSTKPKLLVKPQKAKVELHCVWNVKSQDLSKQAQDKGSAKFPNFDNFSVKKIDL